MTRPLWLVALLFSVFLLACGAQTGGSGWTPAGGSGLPPYTAADAALLDDRMSPEVFGAVVDSADPVGRRARAADGVVRARLVTVTRDAENYVVELAPVPPALKGPTVTDRLSLTIPPANPSYGFLKSFEDELVGRSVIVIYKRFDEGGQATLRWHIEADNPRVLAAIDQARILGELGR